MQKIIDGKTEIIIDGAIPDNAEYRAFVDAILRQEAARRYRGYFSGAASLNENGESK